MKASQSFCILIFFLNIYLLFLYDEAPQNYIGLECAFLILSICASLYFGISPESFPYLLSVLLISALLVQSFINDHTPRASVFAPFVYLLGVTSLLDRMRIVWAVFSQSLWLFGSLITLYYLFGIIGFYVFSQNSDYFWGEKAASLTFMQLSTLDQVGKITRINYQSDGFFKSFFLVICALVIIHSLINMNAVFVLRYVGELYSGRPNTTLSSHRNYIGEHLSKRLKYLRIAYRIISASVLFLPFCYDLKIAYLLATLISTALLILDDYMTCKLHKTKQILNISLQLAILITFFTGPELINFAFCLLRVFLIPQVISLFKKVGRCVSNLSNILTMCVFSFVIFSLIVYLFVNSQEHNQEQEEHLNIFQSMIMSLQFVVLDDWTKFLRTNNWYAALAVVVYVVVLNHMLINMLIAQVFSSIDTEKSIETLANVAAAGVAPVTQFKMIETKQLSPGDRASEAERFADIIQELKYYTT